MCRTTIIYIVYCRQNSVFRIYPFYVLEHVHRRLFGAFSLRRRQKDVAETAGRAVRVGPPACSTLCCLQPRIELYIVIVNCKELYRDPNLISTLPYFFKETIYSYLSVCNVINYIYWYSILIYITLIFFLSIIFFFLKLKYTSCWDEGKREPNEPKIKTILKLNVTTR